MRIVVVGAGIAGLSVAALLARRRHEVTLVEQETAAGRHSSGRSAGIFRLAVGEAINVRLALRSAELAEAFAPGVIERIGAFYPCRNDAKRRAILDASAHAGVREVTGELVPAFVAEPRGPALFSPNDGVIDVPRLLAALETAAREAGATMRFGVKVDVLVEDSDRVVGVATSEGVFDADVVVDATGAFSPYFPADPTRGITAYRRHVFVLPPDAAVARVVWDLDSEIYVRPSAEGLYACACDLTALPATRDAVPVDGSVESLLREKLARFAPSLAKRPILRTWAGSPLPRRLGGRARARAVPARRVRRPRDDGGPCRGGARDGARRGRLARGFEGAGSEPVLSDSVSG